jgi:hypothetical protein
MRTAESVAEKAPRSRSVALLGFIAFALIAAAFVVSLLGDDPAGVPDGLIGARFGMTDAEVQSVVPGLSRDGDALVGRARVFDEPASCRLEFTAGLSRIACNLDPAPSPGEHQRIERRLLALLRQLYGDESGWNQGHGQEWIWQGKRARLRVQSLPPPALGLRIENARLP